MPLYTYRCECGKQFDRVHRLVDYRKDTYCDCGKLAEKILTPVRVVGDYEAYECPVTGKRIEGRRAHEENLKQTGCRILEPGETEAVSRNKAAADAALDRAVEQTVGETIAAMPAAKQSALARELSAGADINMTRL